MKALMAVITALSVPLIILNALGGIVSGIWLAILGEWGAVGLGILFFFVSTWLLGFALLPSMLLAAPGAYCAERGKTLGFVCFAMLSNLYVIALITVWCCGILFLFVRDASASTLIPRLIWSYGVAIAPWAYMASKDHGPQGEGFASALATFFAELAYLVIMLLIVFASITLFGAVTAFGGFMLAGLALQMTLAVMIVNEEKRFAAQSAQSDEWESIRADPYAAACLQDRDQEMSRNNDPEDIGDELEEDENWDDEDADWEDEDEEEDWEDEGEENE